MQTKRIKIEDIKPENTIHEIVNEEKVEKFVSQVILNAKKTTLLFRGYPSLTLSNGSPVEITV